MASNSGIHTEALESHKLKIQSLKKWCDSNKGIPSSITGEFKNLIINYCMQNPYHNKS